MKKGLKTFLIVLAIIIGVVILLLGADFLCAKYLKKPLFAIKYNYDNINIKYEGVFYNTFYCKNENISYIKSKKSVFMCPVINNSIAVGEIKKITEEYLVIEGISNNNALKDKSIGHVLLKNSPKISGAENYIVGQKIRVKVNDIKETDPIQITASKIVVTNDLEEFKIIDETKVNQNIMCATQLEKFYENNNNEYYFSCTKSDYVFLVYTDGFKIKIKEALEKGLVGIEKIIEKSNIALNEKISVETSEIQNCDKKAKLYYKDESRNVYTYCLDRIYIIKDNKRIELKDYIKENKIDKIIEELKKEGSLYDDGVQTYRDGGTIKISNTDFSIIKCNKMLEENIYNTDIYFGIKSMEYEESFCK